MFIIIVYTRILELCALHICTNMSAVGCNLFETQELLKVTAVVTAAKAHRDI